jgi:predicted RNase H-like HicB family nuclease
MRYAVVFEKAARNWAAYVPDLPGCVTTGPTLEDTRRLIAEAIEFHIEGMRLHGEPVPPPSTVVDIVEIAA